MGSDSLIRLGRYLHNAIDESLYWPANMSKRTSSLHSQCGSKYEYKSLRDEIFIRMACVIGRQRALFFRDLCDLALGSFIVCHVKYLYSVISQWKINLAKERENQFGKCTIKWQALPSVGGRKKREVFPLRHFFASALFNIQLGNVKTFAKVTWCRTHNFASLIHSRIFLLRFSETFRKCFLSGSRRSTSLLRRASSWAVINQFPDSSDASAASHIKSGRRA